MRHSSRPIRLRGPMEAQAYGDASIFSTIVLVSSHFSSSSPQRTDARLSILGRSRGPCLGLPSLTRTSGLGPFRWIGFLRWLRWLWVRRRSVHRISDALLVVWLCLRRISSRIFRQRCRSWLLARFVQKRRLASPSLVCLLCEIFQLRLPANVGLLLLYTWGFVASMS